MNHDDAQAEPLDAAIACPVWPFGLAAVRAARNKAANMATLIELSVGTGYLVSVSATFSTSVHCSSRCRPCC